MTRALILAAVSGILCTTPVRAEEPMPVTSDTPDYCLRLAQRMEQAGPMTPDMRVLWEQGREMCQRGHIRGGLARLRRAIMIARGDPE